MESIVLSHLESSRSVKNFIQITRKTVLVFLTDWYNEETTYLEGKVFLADEKVFEETVDKVFIIIDGVKEGLLWR